MHKLKSVREKETHNISLGFEKQTNPQTQTRKPDLVMINEKRKKEKRELIV